MQHMSWMTPDVTVLRSVVLKGIPVLLSDDSSEFYNTCSDTARNEALECITVGVLTVVSEDSPHEVQSSVDLQPIYTAIILEGGIVMDQAASGSLSVVWVYICIAFGLPKMHGKYTQLHSDCDAWTGKEKTPTKTVNSEEQSSGLEQ